MDVKLSPYVAGQLGIETEKPIPWDSVQDRVFGSKGTRRRYKTDREVLYWHIKDAFLAFLFYPLRFLPFGHVAETFWTALLDEGWYWSMDKLAFTYFDDAYVVPLREGVKGKRHHWYHGLHADNHLRPYGFSFRFPLWLLTRLVWPTFKEVEAMRNSLKKESRDGSV